MQSKKDDERGIKRHRCDESSFFFRCMCQGKAQRKASVHEALSHGFRGRLMAGRWGYSVVYFCLVELYLKFWLLKVKTPGKSLGGSNLRARTTSTGLRDMLFVFGCHAFAPKCRCI